MSLSLQSISKVYANGVVGLHSTTLQVESGEQLVLLGPSGSGKSTLLRLIAGLEDADGGEIHIGGHRVDQLPPHKRGVAMIAQLPALYPHLTVAQNIAIVKGADSPGEPANQRSRTEPDSLRARVLKSTSPPAPLRVGEGARGWGCAPALRRESAFLLDTLLNRYPHELSGGERQRVQLAKLFARNATVWLMDEPFNGLDPVFRAEFRHDLHLLQAASRATMLFVTHDPTDALALGRRVGVLGDGRLQQLGTSEQLRNHPSNRFVAFCLGQLSLIDGRVGGGDHSEHGFVSEWGSIVVPLTAELVSRLTTQSNPSLTLGIRPEDVLMVSPANPPGSTPGAKLVGWTVVLAEPVGSGWLLTVARERSRVRVEWRSDSPPPVGASKDWFIPAAQCLWFDGLTGQRII